MYTAWGYSDAAQYPCAVVHAGTSAPVSEDAEWHDARMLEVVVAVMSEAADETDDAGNVINTARERNVNARSKVLDLLAVDDLKDQLIDREIADVAFSMAQMTTTERSVEDKKLITTINLEVIAEPVTGS